MRLVYPETMRQMDLAAAEKLGIPGIILMENAARQIALEALAMPVDETGIVLLLAGPGNNGGDAFAAARHLLNAGCVVRVATIVPISRYKGDAAMNLDILLRMGVPVAELSEPVTADGWQALFQDVCLVLDGLFGTGLSRPLTGLALQAVDAVNSFAGPVLAIDMPSGVDGKTGQLHGAAVRADATVTLAMAKPGLFQYPGAACAGRIAVADIGMPIALLFMADSPMWVIDPVRVFSWLPHRSPDAHKGSTGTLLLVAGSKGMTGAAAMSSTAALRSGAGLVRCALPEALVSTFSIMAPETVILPLPGEEGQWTANNADDVALLLPTADALLVGPGFPVNGETDLMLDRLMEAAGKCPVVLDAGALSLLADGGGIRERLPPYCVLTPHPGEMARLMHLTVEEVQRDRIGHARDCAALWNAVVVLKGAFTVVAAPDGTVFVNPTGNAGMATAGSGDVLAGIVAGLAAQGLPPLEAAVCGVWLHGTAGDAAAERYGQQAMIASDLIGQIGEAFLRVTKLNEVHVP